MAKMGRRHSSNNLDGALLVVSLIMGLIAYIVSSLIYEGMKENMASPLAVGLSFAIFAIVFILLMVFVNMRNDNLGYHLSKHHDGGQIFVALLVIIILTFGLGVLFEFLYERNIAKKQLVYQEPTAYIFVIDNSGSMDSSDPENIRYAAIKQIMSNKDSSFPYAVYGFGTQVMEERALAPVSAGNNDLQPQSLGGTAIRGALKSVYSDCEAKMAANLGTSPKVLLLSDGYATDTSIGWAMNKILKKYAKNNIAISTVGFGNPDEALMQKIADTTGGVYINVDNLSTLEQAMEQAINTQGTEQDRTLYTYRTSVYVNFLYAIMRILFTAILGILISSAMLFATGKGEDSEQIILTSIITGVIAGLLLEVGINGLRLPPGLMKCIYFLLVASTFVTQKAFGGTGSGKKYQDKEDMYDVRVQRREIGRISGVGGDFDSGFGNSTNTGNYGGGNTNNSSGDFF